VSPKSLDFGFYGEGVRDYGFLLPVVRRILENLLAPSGIEAHALSLDYIKVGGLSEQEKLKHIAEKAKGYSLIVYHLDADRPDEDDAYKNRFEPGYAVIATDPDKYNVDIVPIIPIHMTDAWILVDFEAFRATVGTNLTAKELGFKSKPHQIESLPNPKQIFEDAVKKVSQNRRKRIPFEDVYVPLAERIDLQLLGKVSAYNNFLKRLSKKLHYL